MATKGTESGPAPIRLLTFNTWGLKYVSVHRQARLRAIANRLADPSEIETYDIVALQEVWCEDDWDYIDVTCREQYPYRRIFKSGIVSGPGLALLLKIPIDETFLYRFPINGRPSAFLRGDWFVGKSVAVTILRPHHPQALPIAILNLHMHAPYAQTGDSAYTTHRACQAWDMAKITKTLKRAGYAVVQVGDLNSKPGSLPYKLLTEEGGLQDLWDVLHGGNAVSANAIAVMDPKDQIVLGGITCDSTLNTWRAKRQLWEACRLDYALIDPRVIRPVRAEVRFTELMAPPYNCSYSDHFGYSVELEVGPRLALEEEHVSSVQDRLHIYKELMSEIEWYRAHTIPAQATWRKWHLVLGSWFVVAFLVWVPIVGLLGWMLFLAMFVTVLAGVSAAVNGLIWYCGVRLELRALQEVFMEVRDVHASLEDE